MKKLHLATALCLGAVIMVIGFNLVFDFLPDWAVRAIGIFTLVCAGISGYISVRTMKAKREEK